jgi:hypothetical protein
MRLRTFVIVTFATIVLPELVAPVAAQTTFVLPDTTRLGSVERALLRFEQARSPAIARHDTATLRIMYADEFRGVTATGFEVDRARLLTVFTRDDPTTVFTIDALAVRSLGQGHGAAFLTGRLTARRRTGDLVGASRFLHLYLWGDEHWQILAAQGTALPPPG